jgi:hypothetical protein
MWDPQQLGRPISATVCTTGLTHDITATEPLGHIVTQCPL